MSTELPWRFRHPTASLVLGLAFGAAISLGAGWWAFSDPAQALWLGVPSGVAFWLAGMAIGVGSTFWETQPLHFPRPGQKRDSSLDSFFVPALFVATIGLAIFMRASFDGGFGYAPMLMVGGIVLASVAAGAFRARQVERRLHPPPGAVVEHYVQIWDMRPLEAKDFDPYFTAICECGWTSVAKETEADARAEARTHTWHIAEGLERPLA